MSLYRVEETLMQQICRCNARVVWLVSQGVAGSIDCEDQKRHALRNGGRQVLVRGNRSKNEVAHCVRGGPEHRRS